MAEAVPFHLPIGKCRVGRLSRYQVGIETSIVSQASAKLNFLIEKGQLRGVAFSLLWSSSAGSDSLLTPPLFFGSQGDDLQRQSEGFRNGLQPSDTGGANPGFMTTWPGEAIGARIFALFVH